MIEVAQRHPDKPVFNVEHGAYEKTMHNIFHGAYVEPDIALERTYTCVFAGTYSTYYWQNTSWYELVYDPFSLPEINQPHFEYYKILMNFFDNFDFNELVPDQYFYSPFCLTDNKEIFIYLMPRGAYSLEGMPAKQIQGKNVEIQWFNPLTQQMGSAGAESFMISTSFSLTELEGINNVSFDFEEGDHARPGVYNRNSWDRNKVQ